MSLLGSLNAISDSIRVFTGVGCKGNSHRVLCIGTGLSNDVDGLKALSSEIGPDILVVLPEEAVSKPNDLTPEFYHNGQQVRFCGSGVLAAAYFIDQHVDGTDGVNITVSLEDRTLTVQKKNGKFSFSSNAALNAQRVRVKPWEAILGLPVDDAIELPAGYVIVEIASAKELKQLRPNLKQLKRIGGPSLIVTAHGGKDIKEDYAMRYFAPQFGNPEDAATGSANLFLMKYWQLKLNKKNLTGRQMSAQGGLFSGHVRGDNVTLSGRVE